MKIYLAHPISTRGEFEDSKRVAQLIRELGYDVYVASENTSINDKSNNPTPFDIYQGDVSEILTSDMFVVNLTGGMQDGTISEIGLVTGLNEASTEQGYMPIVAYTSNARLLQPQVSQGIPSASANHLVLGMIQKWGGFLGDESSMMKHLKYIKEG